jgi:inorganic pyrophosphatase
VKIEGWVDIDEAHKEIMDGVKRYDSAEVKPAF